MTSSWASIFSMPIVLTIIIVIMMMMMIMMIVVVVVVMMILLRVVDLGIRNCRLSRMICCTSST